MQLFQIVICAVLALANGQDKGAIENDNGSLRFVVASGKDFTFKTGETVKTFAGVEADVNAVKTSLRQTADGLSETDEVVTKLRRDAECAKEDSLGFATTSAQMSANLNEKVAEIMAGVLQNISAVQAATIAAVQSAAAGASADTTPGPEVIHYHDNCPDTGCKALDSTITMVVASKVKETALLQDVPNVYLCQFNSDSLEAPLYYPVTSANGHTINCKVPYFDSTKIKDEKKTFNARVSLLAGLRTEIPYVDQDNLADGDFTVSSSGPSIAAIDDLKLKLRALKKNTDSKHYHALLVKITDPDSPSDALDVTVAATSDVVAVSIAAVDGVADTFKLTIVFKDKNPKKSTFKVTVTAADNHKSEYATSFGVDLTTVLAPSAVDADTWDDFPDGTGGADNYFGATTMKISTLRGSTGAVTVKTSHEYPLFSEFSLRKSADDTLVYQMYKFALDGASEFNGGCDTFFQMGLVWSGKPSQSGLASGNTLQANSNLNRGDGVYFVSHGVGDSQAWHFYHAGANHNACGASDKNNEKVLKLDWKTDSTISLVVYGDSDPDFARQIAVFIDDVKVYTYEAQIPPGKENVYSYVGAGYPDNLANKWQNAAPAFRYAALPL